VSRKQTLQQSECDHISKAIEWNYVLKDGHMDQYVSLYGCTLCDSTSEELWLGFGEMKSNSNGHKMGDPWCDCFGCKARTLQMNPGDATRDISDKKWTSELQAYRDAKSQGIQPAGTNRHQVEAAHKASEILGKAYNAETMPKAKDITPKAAAVMKEIGQI
jgi:hypothetical protein